MAQRKRKPDPAMRIEINGEAYEIDPQNLTWGEMAEVETYFDRSINEIDFESARGTLILAYLAMKRRKPQTTLAELEALPLEAIKEAKPERPTKTPASAGDPS